MNKKLDLSVGPYNQAMSPKFADLYYKFEDLNSVRRLRAENAYEIISNKIIELHIDEYLNHTKDSIYVRLIDDIIKLQISYYEFDFGEKLLSQIDQLPED